MPWKAQRGLLSSVAALAITVGGGTPPTFDFTLGSLPSGVTFSRTTQGTYFNSSGVLTLAAIDAPRLDYDPSTLAAKGLLIEPAATNVCLYSQDFSNASWGTYSDGDGSITKTAAAAVAPDGTTTAGKIDLNRGSTSSFAEAYVEYTGTAVSYTHSLWFKAFAVGDIGKKVMFACYNGSAAGGTVEVTLTADWKRETVTGTMAAATCQMNIGYLSAAGFPGTSDPTGACSFYIWGGQIEIGSIFTSYIPTTSSSVARAADVASTTDTGALASKGFVIETGELRQSATATLLGFNSIIGLGKTSGNALTTADGGTQTTGNTATWTGVNKSGIAFDSTPRVSIDLNGGTVVTAANTPAALTAIYFGSTGGTSAFVTGHVRKVTCYATRTDGELQSATT